MTDRALTMMQLDPEETPQIRSPRSLRSLVARDREALLAGQTLETLELIDVAPGVARRHRVLRFSTELRGDRYLVGVALDDPPTIGGDGQVASAVEASGDLAARGSLEAELGVAREAAAAAARAKSEFLATMSHEIRTPLNGVLGMIELLMTTELTDEQRGYAASVRACGQALLGLITNVLDLSKIEGGRLQLETVAFDPAGLVEESMLVVEEIAAAKHLPVLFTRAAGVPAQVMGDRERVRQVVVNLLSNAVKFTDTGHVAIDLAAHRATDPGSEETTATAAPAEFDLEITVEDTGIGLSEETCASLFQPFFQADGSTTRRHGGSGVGLAISKRIADQMSGRLEVHSIPGEGSRFSFAFPCLEAPSLYASLGAPGHSGASTPSPTGATSGTAEHALKVLVAEDNAVNRIVILKQLSLLGFAADVARNGVEAIASWRRQPYDLVLMDCQMPEMDGFEATRLILAEALASGVAPPVIVAVTANAMEGDRTRCLEAGMSDYLSKPVGIGDLRRIMKSWA